MTCLDTKSQGGKVRATRRSLGMMLLSGVALAACGRQDYPPLSSVSTTSTGPATPYTLGTGDQIRVNVFGYEDLSGEYAIDAAGTFPMPLVGNVHVVGKTEAQVSSEVAKALKDGGYLTDPRVGVQVLTYRPFYILGEVKTPGRYPYENGLTVMEAVATAGGFTFRANQKRIVVRRGGSTAPGALAEINDQILPGDVIEVEQRFF